MYDTSSYLTYLCLQFALHKNSDLLIYIHTTFFFFWWVYLPLWIILYLNFTWLFILVYLVLPCFDPSLSCFREFVNNVWYIKILSPYEVQQMGKEGLDLPNGVRTQRLPGNVNGCDDYMNQKGSRNTMNGIPLGSLDY